MLYPARMKEVTIIVHEHYITELIRRLHESGLVELTEVSKSSNEYTKILTSSKSHEETVKCISYNLRVNRILDVLDRVAPEPEGLFRSFTRPAPRPRFTVKRKETAKLFSDTEVVFKQIEDKILDIDSQLNSVDEQINNLGHQKDQIGLLRPIRFNLDYLGTSKHLMIKAGVVDSIEQLKSALKDLKDVTYRYAEVEDKYSVVIAIHISHRTELENRLRGRFFSEFDISGFSGTPSEVLAKLDKDVSALNSKKEKLLDILKKYYKAWHDKLMILDEELDNEKARKEVFSRFGETKSTKVLVGWVLSNNQDRLRSLCSQVTDGHARCHFRDPTKEEDEKVPVKLHNPRWAKPFEVLTTLFATPHYNEIDPTLIITIPFIFFFGLMLGDAGYGFVIFFLCLFGYFHLGKIRPVVKQASYIGIFMGLSTIIFGLLMGSVFGDMIPRLIYGDPKLQLYKAEVLGFHLPYDPIRSPILLLQISLVIGVSYIMLSIITAAGHNLKYKNYKAFLTGQFPWFLLVPFGLILIFYAFFKFEFSDTILNISYLLIIIGIVLLFIDKKVLFFFDLTGYLGDSLSFARLLALGLATAGIAMTINIIAELMLPGPGMIVVVVILLFFCHLINFVLQALGAGIHSLRLQYVEFFGRCYEGGGNQYRPFRAKRLITKLEPRK